MSYEHTTSSGGMRGNGLELFSEDKHSVTHILHILQINFIIPCVNDLVLRKLEDMAEKYTDTFNFRVKKSTYIYFDTLNKPSKRKVIDYIRAICETMEEKGLTLETLSALPDRDSPKP